MQMLNDDFVKEENPSPFYGCSAETQIKVQEAILMKSARKENRRKFGAKKVQIQAEGMAKKGDVDEVEDPDSEDTSKER
jgi:hypothetical protein